MGRRRCRSGRNRCGYGCVANAQREGRPGRTGRREFADDRRWALRRTQAVSAKFTGGSLDKARLDTLVDAVYAIALTLLVLDLKLPGGLRTFEVPAHLREMLPKIAIYAIAFSTVAL